MPRLALKDADEERTVHIKRRLIQRAVKQAGSELTYGDDHRTRDLSSVGRRINAMLLQVVMIEKADPADLPIAHVAHLLQNSLLEADDLVIDEHGTELKLARDGQSFEPITKEVSDEYLVTSFGIFNPGQLELVQSLGQVARVTNVQPTGEDFPHDLEKHRELVTVDAEGNYRPFVTVLSPSHVVNCVALGNIWL